MSCTIRLWKQREIGVTDLDSYALNIDIRCIFSLSVSLFFVLYFFINSADPSIYSERGGFQPKPYLKLTSARSESTSFPVNLESILEVHKPVSSSGFRFYFLDILGWSTLKKQTEFPNGWMYTI